MGKKRVAGKPELNPVVKTFDRVVTKDGVAIRPGYVVRRVAYESPTLGVTVPSRVGIVKRIVSRQSAPDRIIVECWGEGAWVTDVDRLKRSAAKIGGE